MAKKRSATKTVYAIARCSPDHRTRYQRAADRLGISLSLLICKLLDQVSGRIEDEGWESRRVHLDPETGAICAVGADPVGEGVSAPMISFVVVAPSAFFVFAEGKARARAVAEQRGEQRIDGGDHG